MELKCLDCGGYDQSITIDCPACYGTGELDSYIYGYDPGRDEIFDEVVGAVCDQCAGYGTVCINCENTTLNGIKCNTCDPLDRSGIGLYRCECKTINQIEREIAYEIISVKKEIQKLLIREKELKEKLLPTMIKVKKLAAGDSLIQYVHQIPYKIFKRKSVLHYIKENYGNNLANEIDEVCSIVHEPKPCIHVILNKK